MTKEIAAQIADLINLQNELPVQYTAHRILSEKQFEHFLELEGSRVIGVVRLEHVQWYQAEISHLSVAEDMGRRGLGTKLLKRAETRAAEFGALIAQCTIRASNSRSIRFFTERGYTPGVSFFNPRTENTVGVFQRTLIEEHKTR